MAVVAWLWLCLAASATNVFVVTPGTPGVSPQAPYTNWAKVATNIQDAVDAINTNNGNIVYVTNGTYYLTNYVSITKGIVLRSWNAMGQTDPTNTIIHGNNFPGKLVTNKCIRVNHAQAVLDGLAVTGGRADTIATDRGGGIWVDNVSVITNCMIYSNSTTATSGGYGGGIVIYMGKANLSNCRIFSNTASARGGGIDFNAGGSGTATYCVIYGNTVTLSGSFVNGGGGIGIAPESGSSNAVVRNCDIIRNVAQGCGGGVLLYQGLVESCNIVSNQQIINDPARVGGGVLFRGPGTLRNCLIAYNNSGSGYGAAYMYLGGTMENCTIVNNVNRGLYCTNGLVINTIICSNALADVYASTGGTFSNCCATNTLPGTGNITNNPMFVNAAGGDFRISNLSPCINRGLNAGWMNGATDLDGNRRIIMSIVDIGAYECVLSGTIISAY